MPSVSRRTSSTPGSDPLVSRAVGVVNGLEQRGVPVGIGAVTRRHRAEGVTEQLHGAALGAGIGLAGEHQRARWYLRHQLLDEPGLADAGLAGDEGDRWVGAGVDQPDQAIELGGAADHDG